ncbi:MAG TPA: LTA synthase family protein [Candidatus Scybalocola faecigallinarum]|uniref:LTA synthase family protein n=1 Tax=Candidatus Scybalocola faecigallinarum TaxID=2840941 RepID=A0A9D1F2G3_9FIRM|nr:LTA synthase family protein [Candidatus Scybalocola faecigallinarum]
MKEKILKVRYLVFILFAVKMFVYYIAVDIPIFSSLSYWVTLVFFGLTMYLYYYSTVRTQRILRFIYAIFSIVLFIDVIYYNYFNQLVSVNQIWQIKNIKGTEDSVKSAIPLMSVVILADLPVLWLIYRKFRSRIDEDASKRISLKKKRWVATGLIVSIIIIALNPLRLASIAKLNSTEAVTVHVKDAVESTLGKVVYNLSSLGTILQNKDVSADVVEEISEDVMDETGESEDTSDSGQARYAGVGKGMNLVVIQVESMQNFVLNTEYNGQEVTPYLNQLLKEDTLYFNHYFTNMGKGNTSDAEFSTQTGLYPVIEGASYDMYVDNSFNALPELMAEKGYYTSAAIGDDKDFYNRATVYPRLGFDQFYNEENLDMDEISGLGLSDKSLFRQMAQNLSQQEAPFYSFIITLTNHYPYVLDAPLEATLELKDEDKDTLFGGYLQTIRYTDEAIGEFVEALKENGLYDNTVIVIYGDHHGLNCLDNENYEKMTEFLGYSYDYDTMLNIPLLIHIPGLGEARTIETVGGQVDFLATMANLFDLDLSSTVTFGQDLLNADEGFVATVAYMLQGSFIKDGVLYEIGRDGSFESGRALDLNTHEPISIDGLEEDSQRAVTVTEISKYILERDLAEMSAGELAELIDTEMKSAETEQE